MLRNIRSADASGSILTSNSKSWSPCAVFPCLATNDSFLYVGETVVDKSGNWYLKMDPMSKEKTGLSYGSRTGSTFKRALLIFRSRAHG